MAQANIVQAQEWDRIPSGSGQQSMFYGSTFDPFGNASSSGPRQVRSVLIAAALLSGLAMQGQYESDLETSLEKWRTRVESGADDSALRVNDQSASLVTRSLETLEGHLQLTKSQLASALQVERATLYQWFRGVQPRSRARDRIVALEQFAREWVAAGLGSARASWHMRIHGDPKSRTLGEMLTAEQLNMDELHRLIRAAAVGPLELAELRGVEGFPAEDELEQRRRRRDKYAPSYADKE
jgi:hypothetical protein